VPNPLSVPPLDGIDTLILLFNGKDLPYSSDVSAIVAASQRGMRLIITGEAYGTTTNYDALFATFFNVSFAGSQWVRAFTFYCWDNGNSGLGLNLPLNYTWSSAYQATRAIINDPSALVACNILRVDSGNYVPMFAAKLAPLGAKSGTVLAFVSNFEDGAIGSPDFPVVTNFTEQILFWRGKPQQSCSGTNCAQCLSSNACEFCLDSWSCQARKTPGCNDYWTNKTFCPSVVCDQYTTCEDCTTQGAKNCYFCPSEPGSEQGTCVPTLHGSCANGKITNPKFCNSRR